MTGLEKFGRSLQVILTTKVGPLALCNWVGGQPTPGFVSLHCSVTVTRSVRPQPHECTVDIYGMSKPKRMLVLQTFNEAEALSFNTRQALQAGKLIVRAGYGADSAMVFYGDLAPDGCEVGFMGPGHKLTLRALDGRIPWKGRFVNQNTTNNVDLKVIRGILAANSEYQQGKDASLAFEKQFPGLLKKKFGFPGYESGFAMFGESRKHNRQLCDDLNIVPFFDDGELRYVARDAALLGQAVVLRAGVGGTLLSHKLQARGRVSVTCLLEHRLRPGRQVFPYDDDEVPIGAGLFRVETMTLVAENGGPGFHTTAELVPTKI